MKLVLYGPFGSGVCGVPCMGIEWDELFLSEIVHRLRHCKLNVQKEKTKIVNVRGVSEKEHRRSFDFLGFTIERIGFD